MKYIFLTVNKMVFQKEQLLFHQDLFDSDNIENIYIISVTTKFTIVFSNNNITITIFNTLIVMQQVGT